MFNKIKEWFLKKPLILDWIQVEVSSHCNAHCIYCPRTIYKDSWKNRHMGIDTFSKIIPFLDNTKLVYLQGWGEPFLNSSIFEMIKISKDKGCMVGLTTNATTLDTSKIKEIIKSDLDIIALSLTGNSETNDLIRKGTSYEKVISVINEFNIQKQLMYSYKPLINIAYLLFEKDLKGIYELIDRTEQLGINQIVVSGLDFIANDTFIPHVATYKNDELENLNQLKLHASQKRMQLITNLISTETPRKVCTENVTNSLFISSDGTISPCVYMNLPIDNEIDYYPFCSKKYERTIWGFIHEKSIMDIWFSKEYSAFRRDFLDGNYTSMCKTCPKLYLCDF